MKKAFHFAILLVTAVSSQALAQEATLFPKGAKAAAVHHKGDVWLNELSHPDSIFNFNIAFASFAAGARLDWHSHPAGQVLLITEGVGYYQEKGKPLQTVQKGEVIKCQPDIEHWHGATPQNSFSYLANTPTHKGKTVWRQAVSDAEYQAERTASLKKTSAEEVLTNLSKTKWLWMAERKVDSLEMLFHEKSVFVHMGATMTRQQELDVIKGGAIQYKHAEIQETSVQFIDQTAILLNKIRLTAVVGGNEVVNPFSVTEVYIHQDNKWRLGSLSFTKLVTP